MKCKNIVRQAEPPLLRSLEVNVLRLYFWPNILLTRREN